MPWERMDGRGPGAVDMAKLRIALLEIEHAPAFEAERHRAVPQKRPKALEGEEWSMAPG